MRKAVRAERRKTRRQQRSAPRLRVLFAKSPASKPKKPLQKRVARRWERFNHSLRRAFQRKPIEQRKPMALGVRIGLAVAATVLVGGMAVTAGIIGQRSSGNEAGSAMPVEAFGLDRGSRSEQFRNTDRRIRPQVIPCDTDLMLNLVQKNFPEATPANVISCTDTEVVVGVNLATAGRGIFDAYIGLSSEGEPELKGILGPNGEVLSPRDQPEDP